MAKCSVVDFGLLNLIFRVLPCNTDSRVLSNAQSFLLAAVLQLGLASSNSRKLLFENLLVSSKEGQQDKEQESVESCESGREGRSPQPHEENQVSNHPTNPSPCSMSCPVCSAYGIPALDRLCALKTTAIHSIHHLSQLTPTSPSYMDRFLPLLFRLIASSADNRAPCLFLRSRAMALIGLSGVAKAFVPVKSRLIC